ncbi:G protein-regulated inducer of neurite outgrowth 1-like [Schistocerca piceifrons]|uniref:G protein-regulated inducer of neurite outgrowth 1-like n=1 Tax=Schistocerca piceifrons TaxID=274613 RepID=UPI001F5F83C1|nr:G protein-regulated inducer of neurite outgrowth 1-like [Schistocerca piceifrons]
MADESPDLFSVNENSRQDFSKPLARNECRVKQHDSVILNQELISTSILEIDLTQQHPNKSANVNMPERTTIRTLSESEKIEFLRQRRGKKPILAPGTIEKIAVPVKRIKIQHVSQDTTKTRPMATIISTCENKTLAKQSPGYIEKLATPVLQIDVSKASAPAKPPTTSSSQSRLIASLQSQAVANGLPETIHEVTRGKGGLRKISPMVDPQSSGVSTPGQDGREARQGKRFRKIIPKMVPTSSDANSLPETIHEVTRGKGGLRKISPKVDPQYSGVSTPGQDGREVQEVKRIVLPASSDANSPPETIHEVTRGKGGLRMILPKVDPQASGVSTPGQDGREARQGKRFRMILPKMVPTSSDANSLPETIHEVTRGKGGLRKISPKVDPQYSGVSTPGQDGREDQEGKRIVLPTSSDVNSPLETINEVTRGKGGLRMILPKVDPQSSGVSTPGQDGREVQEVKRIVLPTSSDANSPPETIHEVTRGKGGLRMILPKVDPQSSGVSTPGQDGREARQGKRFRMILPKMVPTSSDANSLPEAIHEVTRGKGGLRKILPKVDLQYSGVSTPGQDGREVQEVKLIVLPTSSDANSPPETIHEVTRGKGGLRMILPKVDPQSSGVSTPGQDGQEVREGKRFRKILPKMVPTSSDANSLPETIHEVTRGKGGLRKILPKANPQYSGVSTPGQDSREVKRFRKILPKIVPTSSDLRPSNVLGVPRKGKETSEGKQTGCIQKPLRKIGSMTGDVIPTHTTGVPSSGEESPGITLERHLPIILSKSRKRSNNVKPTSIRGVPTPGRDNSGVKSERPIQTLLPKVGRASSDVITADVSKLSSTD